MGVADKNGDWPNPLPISRVTQMWRGTAGFFKVLTARCRSLLPDRLSVSLVMAFLLLSLGLSIVVTGVQLFVANDQRQQDAQHMFLNFEHFLQPQLEYALQSQTLGQVDIILDGLITHRDVERVLLTTPTGRRWARGTHSADAHYIRTFALMARNSADRPVLVGEMELHLNLLSTDTALWAQFGTLLVSNLVRACLSAGLLLIVVHRMLIRHLVKIAAHVSNTRPYEPAPRLRLDRAPAGGKDVLDQIVGALHGHDARVDKYVQRLNGEIASRKAAQAAADQAAQARTQFLSNMSQEIRAPMSSVQGLFQLIKEGEDLPARYRDQAEFGYRAAYQLNGQLMNMLDLSRLDSTDMSPQVFRVELRHLAETWLLSARASVQRRDKRIEVGLSLAPDLAQTYAIDGERVSRIVGCLIDNAIKFSDRGEIHVLLRPLSGTPTPEAGRAVGNGIEILVRDCARRIRYEDRELIFERFTRIEDPHAIKLDGAGLGLALAREMSALLGGTVDVRDSHRPGFTNEFRLCLPQAQPVFDS